MPQKDVVTSTGSLGLLGNLGSGHQAEEVS